MKTRIAFSVVLSFLLALPAAAQQRVGAGSAHMQGAFFIWVAAAASIINKNVDSVRVTALTTLGSTENLALMEKGRMQLGASGSAPLYEAYRGEGRWKQPVKSLRTLYVMYPDYWQVALVKNSSANSLADLKGRKISLQVRGRAPLNPKKRRTTSVPAALNCKRPSASPASPAPRRASTSRSISARQWATGERWGTM